MTTPLFDLTGQVALVTGASRGLGQYLARALARAGADLILTSRNQQDLLPFVAELQAMGRRAVPLSLDVRDQASIEHMAKAAQMAFPQIHILVNNAGCNVRKPALDVTWDDWNLILETNLRGTFFVAQAIARHMVAHAYGRIINIGSVTSVFGYAGLAPYGASRGGTRQLTMSLADDWGPHGITVNCLAPGWFETAQNASCTRISSGSTTSSTASRLSARESRMTWTAQSSSSPRKPAATSPARPSSSMAASPPERPAPPPQHPAIPNKQAFHGTNLHRGLSCLPLLRNPFDPPQQHDIAHNPNQQISHRNPESPHKAVRRSHHISRDNRSRNPR